MRTIDELINVDEPGDGSGCAAGSCVRDIRLPPDW